uniref:Uncharacterized protein n=1 Tax=Oryza punctata TaxID=4537 RepID=A0A0E0JX97_ORYPU
MAAASAFSVRLEQSVAILIVLSLLLLPSFLLAAGAAGDDEPSSLKGSNSEAAMAIRSISMTKELQQQAHRSSLVPKANIILLSPLEAIVTEQVAQSCWGKNKLCAEMV